MTHQRVVGRYLLTWVVAIGCLGGTGWCNDLPVHVQELVMDSCLHCHEDAGETPLNLSTLDFDLDDGATFNAWVKVYDRIAAGEMPPETEAKPESALLESAKKQLQSELHQASLDRQRRDGRVPARRLTKLEYSNTVRDLLRINDDIAAELPGESRSGRFDTIGSTQRLSPVHMQAFLDCADRALDAALQLGPNPYRDFEIDIPNSPRLAYHDGKTFIDGGGIYLRTGKGVVLFTEVDFLLPSHAHGFDVPMSGQYRIVIQADAYQSDTEIVMKVISKSTNGATRLLSAFDVEPGEPQTFEVTAILHPGDSFYPAFVMGEGTDFSYIMANGIDGYTGKGLAIRSYRVEGPLLPAWPPPSTRAVLSGVTIRPAKNDESSHEVELDKPPMEHIRNIGYRFARRALRRPPTDDEMDAFVSLAQSELQQGQDFLTAVRVVLKSILGSPQFLIFESTPGELDDYALASRLSYFLWRSTPDDELLRLAGQGKLADPTILRDQVDRMLADKKSQAFVSDFLGQWLRLYSIHANAPDQRLYWEYDELLGSSLVRETERFFADLVDRNLPAENLIDSDFTFLNRRLAEHYGIDGVTGQHFRRVTLPAESVRGGVLTQASVLKTTANGSNTSPVIRGNFVLSNFFGTPPPPPPPSAGSIEPDTRGSTTLREQLAAHRDVDSCNACHRKIDPPGFALESFDPIGNYRDRYRALVDGDVRQDLKVDASGVTEDGTPFSGIREFKQLLMNDKDAFARNLISQLVVFSTGGEIEFADRESIDQMMDATKDDGYRIRDLIHEIVQSRLFREL